MKTPRAFVLLLFIPLMIGIAVAAQTDQPVYYALDDQYAITFPPGWEILGGDGGRVAAQGNGLGMLVLSPSLVGGDPSVPIANGVIAGGQTVLGQEIDPAAIEAITIYGREAAFSEQDQVLGDATFPGRIYAIRMIDGTIGIVNVVAVGVEFADAEGFIAQILNTLRLITEYNEVATLAAATGQAPADSTETATTAPTRTPRPSRTIAPTATITPTPAALEPVSGTAELTITASDGEATCQTGFLPLESVLSTLSLRGELVASEDGETVNFVTESEPSGTLELVREPRTNRYTGRLITAAWQVELRLELIQRDGAPGFVGSPISPFTVTANDITFPCIDRSLIELALVR